MCAWAESAGGSFVLRPVLWKERFPDHNVLRVFGLGIVAMYYMHADDYTFCVVLVPVLELFVVNDSSFFNQNIVALQRKS